MPTPRTASSAASSQARSVREPDLVDDAMGAAVGAASAIFTIHPLDTIKSVVQGKGAAGAGSFAASSAAARSIVGSKGWPGLYAGVPGAVSGGAPAASVRLFVFESIRGTLEKRFADSPLAPAVPFASAAVAGLCGCAVYVPSEVLKQRQQTGQYASAGAAARALLAQRGLRGFYSGFVPTLARDVPGAFVELPIYTALKRRLLRARAAAVQGRGREEGLTTAENLALGATAGGVAAAMTNPMDVVKTRVMLGQAAGVREAVRGVLQAEGPRGFARGLDVRLAMGAPTAAIFWWVYEGVKAAIRGHKAEPETRGGPEQEERAAWEAAGQAAAATPPLE
eukprot:tig00001130_g7248.t1